MKRKCFYCLYLERPLGNFFFMIQLVIYSLLSHASPKLSHSFMCGRDPYKKPLTHRDQDESPPHPSSILKAQQPPVFLFFWGGGMFHSCKKMRPYKSQCLTTGFLTQSLQRSISFLAIFGSFSKTNDTPPTPSHHHRDHSCWSQEGPYGTDPG